MPFCGSLLTHQNHGISWRALITAKIWWGQRSSKHMSRNSADWNATQKCDQHGYSGGTSWTLGGVLAGYDVLKTFHEHFLTSFAWPFRIFKYFDLRTFTYANAIRCPYIYIYLYINQSLSQRLLCLWSNCERDSWKLSLSIPVKYQDFFFNLSRVQGPKAGLWDMYNFFVVANLSANQRLALCGAADVVGGWDENKALMIPDALLFLGWKQLADAAAVCVTSRLAGCGITSGRIDFGRTAELDGTSEHELHWISVFWVTWRERIGVKLRDWQTLQLAFWLQSCHTVCHAWLPLRFHLAWLLQMHVSYYILMFIYLLDWDYPRNALGHHSCFCTLLRLGNKVIQYRNETSKELQRCCVTVHHAFK